MNQKKQTPSKPSPSKPTASITDDIDDRIICDDIEDLKDGGINRNETAAARDGNGSAWDAAAEANFIRERYGDGIIPPSSPESAVNRSAINHEMLREMTMGNLAYPHGLNYVVGNDHGRQSNYHPFGRRRPAENVRAETLNVEIIGHQIVITGACGKAYQMAMKDYMFLKTRINTAIELDKQKISEQTIIRDKIARLSRELANEELKLVKLKDEELKMRILAADKQIRPNY